MLKLHISKHTLYQKSIRHSLQMVRFSNYSKAIKKNELRIEQYLNTGCTPCSLKHLLVLHSNKPQLYKFVRSEIPTRLSRMVTYLPTMFPQQVKYERTYQFIEDYMQMSFAEILRLPETFDSNADEKMTQTLVQVGHRLGGTVEMISDALVTSNVLHNPEHYRNAQSVLSTLFKRNLSLEILVSLYVQQKEGSVATIDPAADVLEAIDDAYLDARHLCEEHYMESPQVQIVNQTKNCHFPAIPSHIYLIFFELLKNALKATVEFNGELIETLPEVIITISDEQDGVLITLEDRGGGIPDKSLETVFDYFSSSAVRSEMTSYQGMRSSPMCGYGFGLSLAKLYCRYFGGNLWLESQKGVGTTAFVKFITNPDKAVENLADIY